MSSGLEGYLRVRGRFIAEVRRHLAEPEASGAGEPGNGLGDGILGAILDFLPEGLLVIDSPDCRIRLVSRYARAIIGRRAEGLTLQELRPSLRLVQPQTGEEASFESLPLVRAIRGRELVADEEWCLERADGERIPVLCNAAPILDGEGGVIGALGSWVDIVDLKLAQASLQESEKRFRAAFEHAAVGMARLDPHGRLMEMNGQFCGILGFSCDELVGRGLRDLTHPDDLDAVIKNEQALLEGGKETYSVEKRLVRKDGSHVWVKVFASLVRNAQGLPDSFLDVVHDITRRRRSEAELFRREQEYKALAENSPDLIARLDRSLRYLYANPAVLAARRKSEADLLGRSLYETLNSPELIRIAEKLINKVVSTGRAETFEYDYDSGQGERRSYQTRIVPEFDRDGGLVSVLAISRDITDLKRLERELRTAKEAAEAASRAKGEFLANMSHEIRTPLNGILGMTDLAIAGCNGTGCKRYLYMIRQSGRNLLGIINDILDFSKIEAGRMELEDFVFDPAELIREMASPLAVSAGEKGLALHIRIETGVPGLVRGDPGKLRQVLTNLVGNAIKFTERGAIDIGARLVGLDNPPGTARLFFSVADTGVGIPADKLSVIFESFSQVGQPAHALYGGTGLGLAISKELVRMMGGRIWAESEPGKGSIFYFSVAVRQASGEEAEKEAASSTLEDVAGKLDAAPGPGPLSVLVAEDNAINRLLVVSLLERDGHAVVAVENGRKAIEALAKGRFDVVLMDVRMPEMDGEEAARIIKRSPPPGVDPSVPLVALTAHAMIGDRERFLDGGFDDYLSKPIDSAALNRVLARIARKIS